ncbi:MAG: DUF6781 family protein [Lautropia sp.]
MNRDHHPAAHRDDPSPVDGPEPDPALEDEVRQAVAGGEDVKEAVRRITLSALTRRELDVPAIRRVARSVVSGARLGAADRGPDVREALGNAMSGLDEALSRAAEATRLALQEAVGRGETLSGPALKQTLKDVQTLEQLFVDTLRDAARGGRDQVHQILDGLAEHARNSGTAVGAQIRESMADLVVQLAGAGRAGLRAGVKSATTTASTMARLASGVLEGIADSLHPTHERRDADVDRSDDGRR